jgi:hypothetical protein
MGPRTYDPQSLQPYLHSIALDEFEFTYELPPEQLPPIRKLRLAAERRGLKVEFAIDISSKKRITLVGRPVIDDHDLIAAIHEVRELGIPVDLFDPTEKKPERPYPC